MRVFCAVVFQSMATYTHEVDAYLIVVAGRMQRAVGAGGGELGRLGRIRAPGLVFTKYCVIFLARCTRGAVAG